MDHLTMPKFGPLSGLRVVFSGIEIAGPFAGQMFAEWGAEVIWIENVAWADTIRVQPNEQSKPVTIVGLQPEEGSSIPGIRRWPAEYMPGIFNASLVDTVLDIHQQDAENTMRQLAVREGIFCGVSSGGAVAGALRIARENPGAVVVAIVCDRGDRYLSTGVFGEEHFSQP